MDNIQSAICLFQNIKAVNWQIKILQSRFANTDFKNIYSLKANVYIVACICLLFFQSISNAYSENLKDNNLSPSLEEDWETKYEEDSLKFEGKIIIDYLEES